MRSVTVTTRRIPALLAVVAAVILVMGACSGGDGDDPADGSAAPTTTEPPADLEGGLEPMLAVMTELSGSYVGSWMNTTDGTSGQITMELSVDEDAGLAVVTFDVNGPVFGGEDPGPETVTARPDALNLRFDLRTEQYGNLDARVGREGLTATLRQLPDPAVDRVDVTGTFDFATGAVTGTFTVVGADGATAEGSFMILPEDAPAARRPPPQPSPDAEAPPPEEDCADPPCTPPG